MITDSTGSVLGQQGHYPFGESWYQTGTTTKWLFTSYERDAESGNDYAMARYDVNRLGRYASPDLLAGSAGDPQSLNRYAYVLNDAVNLVDPLGLRFSYICGFTHECLGGGAGLRMDEGCGGPFSLACDGGGFDSGDGCLSAACQNPGDVLLDGFVTDRGEAEPIVGAGFGFVCPTTDCSGATLTTFNGVDSAIRVPNCSDPTVEDCGYSYYLTNGSTGALGLSGAAPGDDGNGADGLLGSARPQTQGQKRSPKTAANCAANAAAGLARAAHGAEVASTAFIASAVHIFAAQVLLAAGCADFPADLLTCLPSAFGALSASAGAAITAGIGALEVSQEVVPGIEQAATCGSKGVPQ